ncbi:OsmC family protein [Actinomadura roseirufa]|uniref:OsmC family protein n=1 Tax=Actinomadura roseirufa TaxID=2094049 RepID=UPI001041779A|nr:OsmC family protein [Actinomadura roseirufa]
MTRTHHYEVTVTWTGDRGAGTASYRAYDREHEVESGDKPVIGGSSDPAFRGDPDRWNPEELLVASLSQCHMLWYLHLCSVEGVVVTAYRDTPHGTMIETEDGGGRFEEVVLRPEVLLADPGQAGRAAKLHDRAHELCFIANSVTFPVRHEPVDAVS